MNRCSPHSGLARALFPSTLALLALASCLSLGVFVAPAHAQDVPQRIPPIAAVAKRGVLVVTAPPEILLNGQPARLSPGARIRGPNNLLLLSGTLVGQERQVSYVLDSLGLVHEVWILTQTELRARK